jgi:hypothetical protein
VAFVMRDSGTSIRPARIHPPTRPNTNRNAKTAAAFGANASTRSERSGTAAPRALIVPSGTYRRRNTQTTASNKVPASRRNPA